MQLLDVRKMTEGGIQGSGGGRRLGKMSHANPTPPHARLFG